MHSVPFVQPIRPASATKPRRVAAASAAGPGVPANMRRVVGVLLGEGECASDGESDGEGESN